MVVNMANNSGLWSMIFTSSDCYHLANMCIFSRGGEMHLLHQGIECSLVVYFCVIP